MKKAGRAFKIILDFALIFPQDATHECQLIQGRGGGAASYLTQGFSSRFRSRKRPSLSSLFQLSCTCRGRSSMASSRSSVTADRTSTRASSGFGGELPHNQSDVLLRTLQHRREVYSFMVKSHPINFSLS